MSSRKELKEQRRHERLELERHLALQERRTRRLRLAAGGVAVAVAAVLILALRPWEQSPPEPFTYDAVGMQERVERAGLKQGGTEHFHPKVSVNVRGKPVAVPGDMGEGSGLGTHEGDGTIHVEGEPDPVLSEFMAMWGVRLTPRELGPYANSGREQVRMWVKQPGAKSFKSVPVQPNLALKDRMEVYLSFGTEAQAPIT